MKKLILLIVTLGLTTGVMAQEKLPDSFLTNGRELLNDIKSAKAYRAFVSMYRNFDKGEMQEKLAVIGVLGAKLHKLKDEFTYFSNIVKKDYPNGKAVEAIMMSNLGDVCPTCRGGASAPRPCSSCRGEGSCTNASCTDGKVTGYDRVGGRFLPVQRDCIICKGSGNCNSCNGSGETLGACRTCRKSGVVYSPNKALEVYKGLVADLVGTSESINQKAKEAEMLAKGMVKIDGKWYTPDQIAEMEREAIAARRKADEADRRRLEAEENRKRHEEAVALLDESDEILRNDPDQIVNMLQNFINKYPDHEKIDTVKKELQYAGIYREALQLEKEGAVTKALEKYNEAKEVKNNIELKEKIQYLDDQTIGL